MKRKSLQTTDHFPKIAILNAGGQYCHLIARRIRELGVYAEILPCETPAIDLQEYGGIIISGGPASVYAGKKPQVDRNLFDFTPPIPILGICYGHQLIAEMFGGEVRRGEHGEYGVAHLSVTTKDTLFDKYAVDQPVWMSHRDVVQEVPEGFETLATTPNCPVAAMANFEKHQYGLQFHPEVIHTKNGTGLLKNFVEKICRCDVSAWKPTDRIDEIIATIKDTVGERRKVFFLVSGGVDSTVAFSLCVMALGKDRVKGLYVDTGLMRKYDRETIQSFIDSDNFDLQVVDASTEFLDALRNTYSPEQKRKKIGRKFLEITESVLGEKFQGSGDKWILGQGTIYPDTIESGSSQHAARIKTHHNRVSVIQKLIEEGKVVEPLRELYKDEVRDIGLKIVKQLGLQEHLISRHPFPGPGLAIRCLASRGNKFLRQHELVQDTAKEFNLSAAVLPLHTVGVKGDERSYDQIAILFGEIPIEKLEEVSTSITNSATGINRVTYCLSDLSLSLEDWRIKKASLDEKRISLLREADDVVMRFIREHGLLSDIWQFPVILIPLCKKATGGETVVLRPVKSVDGMTAEFSKLDKLLFHKLADQIMRLEGVDAVLLDITNKPPATIEWE